MSSDLRPNVKPVLVPPLEEEFVPAALYNRAFRKLAQSGGVPLILGVEREHGRALRYETRVLPERRTCPPRSKPVRRLAGTSTVAVEVSTSSHRTARSRR